MGGEENLFRVEKARLTVKDENGNVIEVKDFPKGGTLRVMKEDKPDNWHRERFDRFKDGIAHSQIIQDSQNIAIKLMELQPRGINFFSYTLQPKPMPLQKGDSDTSRYRRLYKQRLGEEFKGNKEKGQNRARPDRPDFRKIAPVKGQRSGGGRKKGKRKDKTGFK